MPKKSSPKISKKSKPVAHKKSAPKKNPPVKAASKPKSVSAEAPIHGEITPLLKRFAEAPQFELLGKLSVAQIIPASKSSVGTMVFSDLSQLSEREVGELFRGNSKAVPELEAYLKSIVNAPPVTPPPQARTLVLLPKPKAVAPVAPESTESGLPDVSPVFSSSEAELRLIELQQKLASSKRYPEHKHHKLSEFWDPRWPRAPFEESMTLSQFASIKIDAFLKKRTMTGQKIAAILGAIERFISQEPQETTPVPASTPAASVSQNAAPTALSPSSDGALRWASSQGYLPSHAIGFLKYYELQAARVKPDSSFGKLVYRLPVVLTPLEFIFLWMHCDYEPSMVSTLLKLDTDTGAALFAEAGNKLRRELQQQHAERCRYWELALASAAAPRDELLKAFAEKAVEPDFSRVINLLGMRALGAVRPRAFDFTLKDYLTLNEGALEFILEAVLREFPLEEAPLRKRCAQLLPHVRFEDVTQVLARRGYYDKHRNLWLVSKQAPAKQ